MSGGSCTLFLCGVDSRLPIPYPVLGWYWCGGCSGVHVLCVGESSGVVNDDASDVWVKVGDEEALVTVSDDGYLVAEYEGRDVSLEDFKFDLESLVGELGIGSF